DRKIWKKTFSDGDSGIFFNSSNILEIVTDKVITGKVAVIASEFFLRVGTKYICPVYDTHEEKFWIGNEEIHSDINVFAYSKMLNPTIKKRVDKAAHHIIASGFITEYLKQKVMNDFPP